MLEGMISLYLDIAIHGCIDGKMSPILSLIC